MAESITRRQIYDAIYDGDDDFVIAASRDHREVFEAEGWTKLLESAVSAGRVRLIELFVEAGADINPHEDDSSESDERLIDTAAAEGHLEVVRWLLDHGAKINHEVNGLPVSPALGEAASRGNLELVRLLIERGADVNSISSTLTPLDLAVVYRQKAVADYLKSVGGIRTNTDIEPAPANPPRLKEGQSAFEGKPLGKWRMLFQSNLPPVEQREYGTEYEFGLPATTEQLVTVEIALGIRLPTDVREMLLEFNGIWSTSAIDRNEEYPPGIAFLDTDHMSAKVPAYLADTDNPLPPKEDLLKVVWVAQSNGFGDLWGLCVEDVGKHKVGTVVRLGHEVGEMRKCHPNLAEFIRAGRHDDSK